MLVRFGRCGVAPERQRVTANWCSAIFRRLDALLTRYQAGKLRHCDMPRVVPPGRKIVNNSAIRMPRKWAWLVLTGAHQAAGYGSQIQHVLSAPEMAELLQQSAQARRILRPLCRALAIELPWTVDKPRAERGVTRRRKPRARPEPFWPPLPRGVITWARREKGLETAIKLKKQLVLQMAQKRGG